MFKKIKNWCNANQGWLTFIALIITIFGLIPLNRINFVVANTFWEEIIIILYYNIKIPAYLIIIALLLILIYISKIRRKYLLKKITFDTLEGNWKNEWKIDGIIRHEYCQINSEKKYFVSGDTNPWFIIENFEYNYATNKITFVKSAIREGDTRKMKNVLTVENNDLLVGTEDALPIKYERI